MSGGAVTRSVYWGFCRQPGLVWSLAANMPLPIIHKLENWRRWSIGLWNRFRALSGWRKSAFINTVLVSIVFLVLFLWQIIVWARTGEAAGYQIIHTGRCDGNGVGRLNTVLHLIINILSSLVLASTNFFMQVLNAPSREELDSAHEKGSWLDIGVPSPRNAFRVSRFKMIMWLLFFLSSVPMHLLFNSAIFSTDHRGSTFNYFVFDESVLTGGAVFDPGTSLALPYSQYMVNDSDYHDFVDYWYNNHTYTWPNSTSFRDTREMYFQHGQLNRSTSIQQTVEGIRKGNWERLDVNDCSSMYKLKHCAGLRTHRNVALILSGSSGWNRSQVWDLPVNESSFWDAHVPKDVNNSLWFANVANGSYDDCSMYLYNTEPEVYCSNTCDGDMGFGNDDDNTWNYPLFIDYPRIEFNTTSSKPEFENSRLNVEYCLAEPFPTDCHIGMALNLLLVVSVW